ncbi:hypothetical protein SBC2_06300 [Caballeronia sp. SBC2]|nr:hypothetical protein SBC2_06300 [Caballeronia sp. SBC2]
MRKRRNFTILGIFSRTELPRGSLRGNAEACAAVCFGFVSRWVRVMGDFAQRRVRFLFVLLRWVVRCHFARSWGGGFGSVVSG